jgi:hypothetical protein
LSADLAGRQFEFPPGVGARAWVLRDEFREQLGAMSFPRFFRVGGVVKLPDVNASDQVHLFSGVKLQLLASF